MYDGRGRSGSHKPSGRIGQGPTQGGSRGGRGMSNDALPLIKDRNSRYFPYCTTVLCDYNARVKCSACKKILPKNPPTLPSGYMWCEQCRIVCVSALHACCQMCGWKTPLGQKKSEALERCQSGMVNLEIEDNFRKAEIEAVRIQEEEIEIETEGDRI